MPLPILAVAQFPNVPNLPGVPQLARTIVAGFYLPAPTLGKQAAPDVLFHATQAAPVWGVFDSDGNQVITPDSVLTFDYRNEYRVTSAPVQNGGFQSFNKVAVPFEASVRLTKGGSVADRTDFLNSCEAILSSTNLYSIVTPERSYPQVNPTRLEMSRRETHGAFFVEVELYFVEIRLVTPQYSTTQVATANAQMPAAQPPVNQGKVQPAAPAQSTLSKAADYLRGIFQ